MKTCAIILASCLLVGSPCLFAQDDEPVPYPADMSQPVQVYILLGQSNMLGFGRVEPGKKEPEGSLTHAVQEKGLYPYLVDEEGKWTERMDVRNVRVQGSGTGAMRVFNNEWMTIGKGKAIGPEIGIGHSRRRRPSMRRCSSSRVVSVIAPWAGTCCRRAVRVLSLLTAKGVTWIHPGYKGTPEKLGEGGTEPKKINWYAGMQYDGDIAQSEESVG